MLPATRSRPDAGRRRRRNAAFTIIEVAMASFVMAFSISSAIITLQSGFKAIDVARGTTLAAQIIQSEMERLRMMPWNNTGTVAVDSIAELPDTETFDGATYFSSSTDVVGRYTITRAVEDDAARPGEARNITVTVRWQSYDGRWHQRSFTALYCKNGLYDFYYTLAHS